MLDPERDLKGATPETLARALLRPRQGTKVKTPKSNPLAGETQKTEAPEPVGKSARGCTPPR